MRHEAEEAPEQEQQPRAITVEKKTWLGWRLVGWVEADGATYSVSYSNEPRLIKWSMDKQHRVFLYHHRLRGLAGYIDERGWVYAQYGKLYGSHGAAGRSSIHVSPGYEPAFVFQATQEGEVFEKALLGFRLLGRVEGVSDIYTVGALALLLLL